MSNTRPQGRTRRTAHTLYEFNEIDGRGEFMHPRTRIAVDDRSNLPNGYEFALELDHKNYLHCRLSHDSSMIYDSYDYPLASYFPNNPNLAKVETFNHLYDHLSDIYREIIRGMIEFVAHIHCLNRTMNGGFDIDYLVVKNDVVKFWGVEFWTMDAAGKMADYMSIANVITQLHQGETALPLLTDLVSTLQTQSLGYEHFIARHLVILTTSERLAFIKSASDKRPPQNSAMNSIYLSSVRKMGCNANWRAKFRVNDPVAHGPLYVTFSKGKYGGSNQSILTFCRNSAAHFFENAQLCNIVIWEPEIDLMIMSEFSTQLINFQKELSKLGVMDFKHFF